MSGNGIGGQSENALNLDNQEKLPGEMELRAMKAPWPKSQQELTDFMNSMINRPHDYGSCAAAVSLVSVAAFNYMAHKLGITGFQASCADMDFIRRTRDINGGFGIVKMEDMLYPQNANRPMNTLKGVTESEDARKWLKEEALKRIANNPDAHPNVVAHWQKLASWEPAAEGATNG